MTQTQEKIFYSENGSTIASVWIEEDRWAKNGKKHVCVNILHTANFHSGTESFTIFMKHMQDVHNYVRELEKELGDAISYSV